MRLAPQLLGWSVPLGAEAAALVRSAVLARAIGGEELGRAMVLTLVLRLAEMVSDVGIDRFLIQWRGEISPALLAALHGASLVRGLGTACLVLALSLPAVAALEGGASAAAYVALALVPFLRSFLHLDYRLAESELRLRPMAVVEGGSVLAMLGALPLAVLAAGDHRAMLVVLLVQVAAQVALSHRVATRPYGLTLDRAVLAEVLGFGAPLVLNAGLMFLTFQADRLIVAGFYGWAEVAVYGVALQLAMLPAQIAGRAAGSLVAPRMRMAGDGLGRLARFALAIYLLIGLAFALGFALCAPPMIALVYGAAFRPDPALALALGLAAGARLWRTPLSQLAVVMGRTGDPARANLWRALALVLSLGAAWAGLPLAAIALTAAVGEGAATLRALHLARGILFPRFVLASRKVAS